MRSRLRARVRGEGAGAGDVVRALICFTATNWPLGRCVAFLTWRDIGEIWGRDWEVWGDVAEIWGRPSPS